MKFCVFVNGWFSGACSVMFLLRLHTYLGLQDRFDSEPNLTSVIINAVIVVVMTIVAISIKKEDLTK